MKLAAGGRRETAGGPGDADEAIFTLGSDEHCEGTRRIPGASPGAETLPGQVAITARSAGPVRGFERVEPRMTRAGGVSNAKGKKNETRGVKKPHGRAGPSLGAEGRRNVGAGWSGGVVAAGRHGATGEC